MNSAYSLGRSELLGWLNDLLGTRFTRIEDTASGAIACQLMDALHPGVVPLKKVDFNAKNEYDMVRAAAPPPRCLLLVVAGCGGGQWQASAKGVLWVSPTGRKHASTCPQLPPAPALTPCPCPLPLPPQQINNYKVLQVGGAAGLAREQPARTPCTSTHFDPALPRRTCSTR